MGSIPATSHPVRDADRICQSPTPSQNLDRQIGALRSAGCDTTFREKASGKAVKNRPQLERAIDALGTGDIVIVAEWDRATRSMMDGINIMQRIAERGAAIKMLGKRHLRPFRRVAGPWHQVVELSVRPSGGDALEGSREPGARVYAVELGGREQRGEGGPGSPAAVGPRLTLPPKCPRS